jgi:transcriptional regulator with XRE-family HTH domain
MHSRLKNWMESKGLRSSELADNICVARATVSHILSGRNKPSIDLLQKLLSVYPKLNSNWLITGIGYMNTTKEVREVRSSKSIDRVVVFYDDKSFEEVEKNS